MIERTGAVLMGKRTLELGDPDSDVGRYELHLDVMPVLLGAGIRLFDDPDLERLRLERVGVEEIGPRAPQVPGHQLALVGLRAWTGSARARVTAERRCPAPNLLLNEADAWAHRCSCSATNRSCSSRS
jgi:hypothetical protein